MIEIFTKILDHELNIIHIDMDAFYASVEEADNPRLKGTPVIVGGKSNHGIVTTANYEARKYGIHSAMPIFMAKKKCPMGNYIRPRMERYREVSRNIFDILYTLTDKVEGVSVDEAYIDIEGLSHSPEEIIGLIKEEVYKKEGITFSAGLSYNKFLAKLASDWDKPNGFTIISEEMLPDILLPLSIGKIHGVGPKTKNKLESIGIYTVEDMYQLSEDFLFSNFGKSGLEIYQRIRGVDTRQVDNRRERKSIGVERTFSKATRIESELVEYLSSFSRELEEDLYRKRLQGRTLIVKIKDEDFKTQTRSKTLDSNIHQYEDIFNLALSLFHEIKIKKKIRLLGISIGNLSTIDKEQLSFFD